MILHCNEILVAFILIGCLIQSAIAQDTNHSDSINYSQSTYRLQDRLFSTYLVNNFHRFNLDRPDSLGKTILAFSQESKKLLVRSKVFSTIGSILTVVGCLSVLEGPVLALREPDSHPLPGILLVGGWSMLVISIPIELKASNLRNQFIWTLNRDALLLGKRRNQK